MPKLTIILAQLILFILFAPFLSGLITKIKNNIRMRSGPSVFQPYYNLAKLFSKGEVISETASWIFQLAPFVAISSSLAAALLIPVFFVTSPLNSMADFIAVIFILGLGRFFMALAALDAGSSFGGMGSSREMFISSLAEPVLCLVIFAIGMQFGSTNIAAFSISHNVSASSFVAVAALFLVTIAETSRIPVDNQETHLELTMIHEAMILEYSGRRLALIEMSSYIKQMIWFWLIAQIAFPMAISGCSAPAQIALWVVWYLTRMIFIAFTVALVEVSVAKMRLFRVADFLGLAFVFAVIAVVCAVLGV